MFKHITVKDNKDNAKKFFKKYGGLFAIKQAGLNAAGEPAVVLNTCNDEIILVEKRKNVIFINKQFFALNW